MKSSALEKRSNIIQPGFHVIQRCFYVVQSEATRVAVKVRQVISITKNNTIPRIFFMPDIKMAIRWINAKQNAVAERVINPIALWFPVVGVPCPIGASVMVGRSQNLTTSGATSLLPLPSLLYSSSGKGSYNSTFYYSQTRFKNGWLGMGGTGLEPLTSAMICPRFSIIPFPPICCNGHVNALELSEL